MKIRIEAESRRSIEINTNEDDEIVNFMKFILENFVSEEGYKRIITEYISDHDFNQSLTVGELLEQLETV